MKLAISFFLLSIFFVLSGHAITRTEHAYLSVLNGIELNNACVTPTHVQTIRGVKVCIEKKSVTEDSEVIDSICTKWATETLAYPREYKVQKCVQFKNTPDGYPVCGKYQTVSAIMPQTIDIRTWTENGDYNNYPGTTKKFTFPNCK